MRTSLFAVIVVYLAAVATARAEDDKGEPQFGFTEEVDIGDKGDRAIEIDSTSGLGKRSGSYAATLQSIAAKYTILDDFRIAPIALFSHHRTSGVPDMDDIASNRRSPASHSRPNTASSTATRHHSAWRWWPHPIGNGWMTSVARGSKATASTSPWRRKRS